MPIGSALGHQAWAPAPQQQPGGSDSRGLNPPSGGRVFGLGSGRSDPEAGRGDPAAAARQEREPLLEQVRGIYM